MTIRTLRFGSTLLPDDPLRQDARYTLGQEDRQQIDTQIRELQTFASRAHLNGAHGTYLKLTGDGALGDVVCSAGGLAGSPTVKVATAAALETAGVALGVLLEAATSGSKVLVAIGGVIAPTVTGLSAGAPGWVRVDAAGRCERVDSLADDDVALGHVDAGGYLTLGIRPSSVAGTDLAAEKLLVDDTTTTLANGRALRALTATIPILAIGAVPVTVSRQDAAGSVVEAFGLGRAITAGGAGTSGTGVRVAVRIPDGLASVREAGRVRWEWVSATPLSLQSKVVVSLEGNDGHVDCVTVKSTKAIVLHGYTTGRLKTDASGNVTSTAITFDEVNAALAAATAPVDMAGQRIRNVGTPTDAADAATKDYVEGYITAGAGLAKTGGQLDIVAADGTIVVNADSIQVGTVQGAQVTPDFVAQNVATTGSVSANELTLKVGGNTTARLYKTAGYALLQSTTDAANGLFMQASTGAVQVEGLTLASLAAGSGPVWLRPGTGITVFYKGNTEAAQLFLDVTASSYLRMSARSGTGANPGSTFEIAAQQGQAVAGGTNNAGGDLDLRSGAPGTGGTGGAAGNVLVRAGSTERVRVRGDVPIVKISSLLALTSDALGSVSGSVTLSAYHRYHELTVTGNVTLSGGPTEPNSEFRIIAYRNAASTPTITWPGAWKFATGEGAISATDLKYTIWDFHIDASGTVHCTSRHTNE